MKEPLDSMYHKFVSEQVDIVGLYPLICLAEAEDGKIDYMSLAFGGPEQATLVYQTVTRHFLESRPPTRRLIFGLDRFLRPDQDLGPGIDSVVSVQHFDADRFAHCGRCYRPWRYGIIPYKSKEPIEVQDLAQRRMERGDIG